MVLYADEYDSMHKRLLALLVGVVTVGSGFFLIDTTHSFTFQEVSLPPQAVTAKQTDRVLDNREGITFLGIQVPTAPTTDTGVQDATLKGGEIQDLGIFSSDEPPSEGVNLEGADLYQANLQGVYLLWANLCKANLNEANLQGTYLSWANLAGASLVKANLQAANLQGANFEKANLQRANLKKANLQGANLLWANLSYAHLEGANLSNTFLSWVNMYKATYDSTTQFPASFNPKKHGLILIEPEQ